MKIYQSSSKSDFLKEVTSFALDKFTSDFSKLKIILPSGLMCSKLQNALIKQLGTSILPTIIPLSELIAEEEEIFKIPSEQIGTISKLEEKITLAKIIHSYDKLDYDLAQSLRLAPSLAGLFFEFEANNIKLENLKNIPALDQPQHWHTIYEFLKFAETNWKEEIHSLHKLTRASYQKLMFESEINRLKNNVGESLLLAGLDGGNMMNNEFIVNANMLNNAHIILPPTPALNSEFNLEEDSALYKLYNILELLGKPEIELIGTRKQNKLDALIVQSTNNAIDGNIEYVEFENIFHEAEYISLKCKDFLYANTDGRIALVAHGQDAKEQYSIFLDKYKLSYHDLFGRDVIKHEAIEFILLLAENICCEFNSKALFSLLAHPLINSKEFQAIKQIIRKKDRLASSFKDINELIKKHGENNLSEYFQKFYKILSIKPSLHFDTLFRQIVKATEGLLPDIWKTYPDIAISLSEITQVNWTTKLKDSEEFPELLKQILEGGRLFDSALSSNITICRANDSCLINYDLIIMTDMNENAYPMQAGNSPWINRKLQQELGLRNSQSDLQDAQYGFYLNMHNKNVLLTRAKKQNSTKRMLPSPFILHLKHIMGSDFETKIAEPEFDNILEDSSSKNATSSVFPVQISATDIETLIRTPYNFYAKKILNLRSSEDIDEKPNLAEFGNFFHHVAEEYTKNYGVEPDKLVSFMEITNSLLCGIKIPNHYKKAWRIKLSALAKEFIQFDEERRKTTTKIYSEIRGELELDISGKKVKIMAIADRIEVNEDGEVIVLDYKTGALPTKKDVLAGLSPQLMIEAIIISEGGFNIESRTPIKLIYIKVASNKPYISTSEIEISHKDIYHHKQGLIALLTHYIESGIYPLEPNLMKYDDYSHLARRA